jgi:hypothetical protein
VGSQLIVIVWLMSSRSGRIKKEEALFLNPPDVIPRKDG